MAKNDFSSEAAQNYEQKCLCVLVLDTSASMNEIVDDTGVVPTGKTIFVDGKTYDVVDGGVSKLDGLRAGLRSFYDEIQDDDAASQKLEICVVTFNDIVTMIQAPSLISECEPPTLKADGDTALVAAVEEAIDIVEARKKWYRETGQAYYRPWIILLTDGEPSDGEGIPDLAARIHQDTENKRYVILPIGVDNADMEILRQLEGNGNPKIPAMKLQGAKFAEFFRWLSASVGSVVDARDGAPAMIAGTDDWMDSFTI